MTKQRIKIIIHNETITAKTVVQHIIIRKNGANTFFEVN
jgi:hypothetical protein